MTQHTINNKTNVHVTTGVFKKRENAILSMGNKFLCSRISTTQKKTH